MTASDFKLREQIIKGLKLTYERLIKYKIDRNFDLVISENGKVVRIDPKTFKK